MFNSLWKVMYYMFFARMHVGSAVIKVLAIHSMLQAASEGCSSAQDLLPGAGSW